METLLQSIFTLLTTPPGNLVYHLVLAFSVVTSLQAVVFGQNPEQRRRARRMLLALVIILVSQLIVFVVSGLVWQGLANPQIVLPPLDRAVILLSLVWIAWMWAFPDPNRPADIVLSVLNMAVVVLFLVNITYWSSQTTAASYNSSAFDLIWSITGLVLSFFAILLLAFRRPDGWGIGLGFFVINLAGFLAHWLWGSTGQDFAGFIRLAQLSTYPLIPSLARRLQEPVSLPSGQEMNGNGSRKRIGTDPRTIQAWLDLAAEKDPENVLPLLLRAITQSMVADLCLLVSSRAHSEEVVINSGYDLIREEPISPRSLTDHQVELVTHALEHSRPIRLSPEEPEPDDLRNFAEVMDLKDSGYLLAVPVQLPETEWAGLVLLSPYSNRSWSMDDQSSLVSMTGRISEILSNPKRSFSLSDLNDCQQQLKQAREDFAVVQQEKQDLQARLSAAHTPASGTPSDMEALLAVQQEAQDAIARLEAENRQLQSMIRMERIAESTGSPSQQAEAELRLALQEVAHLRNELAAANMKLLELQQQSGLQAQAPGMPAEEREMLTSIIQEIRQPLSSIIGYTDLLLGESVGILGALQHKFLERIKTSTERMRVLLDDLLQISHLQQGSLELSIQPVELEEIVDQTISDMRGMLREKQIMLRLDLPENLPKINADRDALQQIITHLLHNAREVTPQEGTIILKALVQSEDSMGEQILLQVTDSGGGIPMEDLPRVFTRIYRAEHPLIPGIGDSGVGLSIAKTLVQALGGKIWVESEPEKSTTFSVLLPIEQVHVNEPRQAK